MFYHDKKTNAAEDRACEDPISGKIMDILCDEQYLNTIKDMLFATTLMGKLEELLQRFNKERENCQTRRQGSLEEEFDLLEQYSHRSNLRFQGLPADKEGEDPLKLVLEFINDKMGITHPLEAVLAS